MTYRGQSNRFAARRRARTVAVPAVALLALSARADVIDNTWLGGTGSWNDPTKWSAGVVPNNSGSTTFRVSIPSGSVTRMEPSNLAIDALMIGANGLLDNFAAPPAIFSIASSTLVVDGRLLNRGPIELGANALLSGSGTISAVSNSMITAPGGMTIETGLTVAGSGGIVGNRDAPLTIRGHIIGNGSPYDYAPFTIAGTPINNLATIDSPRTTSFGGRFTRADLGNLTSGTNTFYMIIGTLLNQGQTLQVDADHRWLIGGTNQLSTYGTIQGGTIEIAAGSALSTNWNWGANLDDVWLNGRFNFGGQRGRLTIVDGTLKGNAEIVLDTTSIDGPSRMVSGSSSLVISSTATVHGGGGFGSDAALWTSGLGPVSGAGVPVLNHGTIIADFPSDSVWSRDFYIVAPTLFNDGTVGVQVKSRLRVSGDLINLPGGVLAVEMGAGSTVGLIAVEGQLHLVSLADVLSLTTAANVHPMQYYRIATAAGGITGQFDNITPGFEVKFQGNDIFARLVPEPHLTIAAVALLLCGQRRPRRGTILRECKRSH